MEKEPLQKIFEKIQTGIVIIDPVNHVILDINPNALALIGRKKEDIIGRECHQFICPAERGKCPITDLGQFFDNTERVLIDKDNTRIPVLKSATVGGISGKEVIIESFIDIRDKIKAEERRCALIGYIDETVMRIHQPLVVTQQNLARLSAEMESGNHPDADLLALIRLEAARIKQVLQNTAEIRKAIAEERDDIPEQYRAFIRGEEKEDS